MGGPGDYKICLATGQSQPVGDKEIRGLIPLALLGPELLAAKVEKTLAGS